MKKVLSIALLLVGMMASAQEGLPTKEDGTFEKKVVVRVDSVDAQTIYDRAMMAISSWSSGKTENSMDYHDRNAGILIYKGVEPMGFKNVFLGDGWERYINYSLKVHCKDGRAQVTVSVPTIFFVYNKNGMRRNFTIEQLNQAVKEAKSKKKERGEAILQNIDEFSSSLLHAMELALQKQSGNVMDDDDDF